MGKEMKVTVKIVKKVRGITEVGDVVHHEIAIVVWDGDWVRLLPLSSRLHQISYRKDLVFAVIEEEEQ